MSALAALCFVIAAVAAAGLIVLALWPHDGPHRKDRP